MEKHLTRAYEDAGRADLIPAFEANRPGLTPPPLDSPAEARIAETAARWGGFGNVNALAYALTGCGPAVGGLTRDTYAKHYESAEIPLFRVMRVFDQLSDHGFRNGMTNWRLADLPQDKTRVIVTMPHDEGKLLRHLAVDSGRSITEFVLEECIRPRLASATAEKKKASGGAR